MDEKIINKVKAILPKYDAEADCFNYDITKRMVYVLVRDKLNRRKTQWVSCCTILLMPDKWFKDWRAEP